MHKLKLSLNLKLSLSSTDGINFLLYKVILKYLRSFISLWIIKIIVRSFGSSKNTKLEDGSYCTISGNEPLSVTLYKTGSESQTFCCNFKNLHLCSLNQRLKFPKGLNNQNTVKKNPVFFGSSTIMESEEMHLPGSVPSWGTGHRRWSLMARNQSLWGTPGLGPGTDPVSGLYQ